MARYNPDGTLDTTFGTSGPVTRDFAAGDDFANGVAMQADGKIVVGGTSDSNGLFALARYNTNGSLDSGFGTGGLVTSDFGSGWDIVYDLALQPDGKILAAGYSTPGPAVSANFALARYNPDGSLDTTFGSSGLVTTDLASGTDSGAAVVIQPDGRIVAAGWASMGSPTGRDFALARYQSADCNGNGMADTCDIDCGPQGGLCDVPGCGQSEDCNGNGAPDECDTPVCGDGCVMGTEMCDGGVGNADDCCDDNCMFELATTVCRTGSGDLCDPDEFCTGSSQACPADTIAGAGTVCNPGSGDLCDPDEVCSGLAGEACPVDAFDDGSTNCRTGSGDLCDPDEFCPGVADGACPANSFDDGSTVCRMGSGDLCDPDEFCTGTAGYACPTDAFEPGATVCSPSLGECGVAERCPGLAGLGCPSDSHVAEGTPCGADATECKLHDTCNASGACVAAPFFECGLTDDCCPPEGGGDGGACGPRDHDLDCGDPVPTVSTWGLLILALLLMVTGKVYFGRRRTPVAA